MVRTDGWDILCVVQHLRVPQGRGPPSQLCVSLNKETSEARYVYLNEQSSAAEFHLRGWRRLLVCEDTRTAIVAARVQKETRPN